MDDLRWDDLGCMGHPFARTPHIDRIAREGALFRNAFATTPLCSPSRASFLTGRYPHAHGILDNVDRSALSHQLVTWPRLLHDAGYETGYVGKWHMGNDDTRRPGFDYWVSVKGQGTYTDPELNDDGKVATVPGYVTDIFNDRAVAFLKRPRTKPFLLYIAHKAVHPDLVQYADGRLSDPSAGTFVPAARHRDLYAANPVPRRPNVADRLDGKPALRRPIDGVPPLGPETGTSDAQIRNRLRVLMAVEEGVGRIFEALEQTGKRDDTLVIFTSDHGYFYGEHGLSVERRLAYEESIRIPLLMRYPRRVRPGTELGPTSFSASTSLPRCSSLAALAPVPKEPARQPLARPFARGTDVAASNVVSDRVFLRHRHRLPADAADGLQGGAHRSMEIYQLYRPQRHGRALRPGVRPVRDPQPSSREPSAQGAARGNAG